MKNYQLTIESKNDKSLKDFYIFLNNTALKPYTIEKCFQRRKKKIVVTLLKSPHINKTAQEQFEFRVFKQKFNLYSSLNHKWLIFLKKIKNNIFPDLKFKIKFSINSNLAEQMRYNTINIDNFKLSILVPRNLNRKSITAQKDKTNRLEKIKNVFTILEIY